MPDNRDAEILQVLRRQFWESISFLRNAASYWSRPSLRSQSRRSIAAPLVRLPQHNPPGETACLGHRNDRFPKP